MRKLKQNAMVRWVTGASIVCFSAVGLLLLPQHVLATEQVVTAEAVTAPVLSEVEKTAEAEAQGSIQAVKEEMSATGATVEKKLQQAVPAKETATTKPVAASPEEALTRDFIDWTLHLFSMGDELDVSLETNRNYTVTKAAEAYQVRLDPFRFSFDKDLILDLSPLLFICKPQGKDKLAVEMQVPGKWLIAEEGESVSEITIKKQQINGVWDRSLQFFEQVNMDLGEIVIKDTVLEDQLIIQQIGLETKLASEKNGQWQERYQGSLKGISLAADGEGLTINNIGLLGQLSGSDFQSYIDVRKNFLAVADSVDKAEGFAELKVFFTGLDTLLGLLESSESKFTIEGVTLNVDESLQMDKMELSSVINKDPKTGKLLLTGKGEMSGVTIAQQATEENLQPFSASFKQLQINDQAEVKQIPPTFFADMYTVLEKGLSLEDEQAVDDYVGAEGLGMSKKVLALLASSSTEISLNGLTVNNVMPEPITLGTATAGGDYTASSGKGSAVNVRLGFSDFKGMEMVGNFVPNAAALNFGLANIPSLLNLITDPGALVQGDTDQVQGQVMMNGMGALLGSSLAFSLTDSFVAFPESRFNLDLSAAVDNAARFLSTGSMKIAIENPDAFMQMAQDLGADQGVVQMMTAVTAMANRTKEKGKVVDRLDANVTPEGKVFVNNKDVTLMFFPGQAEAGAEQEQKPAMEEQQVPAPTPMK